MHARFGDPPAEMVARVEEAPIEQIEQWARRMLMATTLAAVLDDPN
jgi:hypothetical protein